MAWIFIGIGAILIVVAVGVGLLIVRKPESIRLTVNNRPISQEEAAAGATKYAWMFGSIMGGVGAILLVVGIIVAISR